MPFRLPVLLLIAVPAIAQDTPPRLQRQPREVAPAGRVSTSAKEAALGAALVEEATRRTTPLTDPDVLAYVDRLGRRLAASLPEPDRSWTFRIIADDRGGRTYEPLSFPGGHIFVPARLFLTAADEAEFAGMLAHAMGHVVRGPVTRPAARGQTGDPAGIPLIFLGGWSGLGADGSALLPLSVVPFQREAELESDRLAVSMLAAAGYDPAALLRYILRAPPEQTGRPEMSPMPPPARRSASLEQAIRALPAATYGSPGEEFRAIQEIVRGLLPAPVKRTPSLYK